MPVVHRFLLKCGRGTLHLLTVGMFFAGFSALLASAVVWSTSTAEWVSAVLPFTLKSGLTLCLAAAAAFTLMPAASDMIPRTGQELRPDQPARLGVPLIGLAVLAVWQVPALLAWFAETRRLLEQVLGKGADPLGLNMIPAAVLYAAPSQAGLALLAFVLTTAVVILARAEFTFRILGACLALQAGFILGAYLTVDAMHALGVWFHELFTSMAEKPTAASVEEWFARFAAAASPVIRRLLWTLGGYSVAVVVAEVAGRRVTVQPEPSAAVFGPAAPAVVPPASAARQLFESSNYAVKPRKSWGGLIMRAFSDYDIRAVPSMAHNRFSFSWSTGVIRREPDGPDLIAVRKLEGQSWFSSPSYTVIELATGASLATLTPQGADWQIANARGETWGTVVQDRVGIGNLHYVTHVGPHHVCSFVWAMHGLSVFSAELDIEFAKDCDERFDRSIAMGLAPLIEQKARLTSERHR